MQVWVDALVVGAINTIVALPVTLAFIEIIFRSHRFRAYTSALAKLAFFGSAVHQARAIRARARRGPISTPVNP